MIHSRSTYGHRAAICEKFGWTLDYLTHGVSWAYITRCLIDSPRYESNEERNEKQTVRLTEQNANEFLKLVNG